MRKFALLLIIIFYAGISFAQVNKNQINPNGYNVFYYPNGFKSSEGYMRNGKPDGYWITYYVNGQKKSEGNRKNFLLDSIWIFYTELGDTLKKISYRQGKKNGYYWTYYTRLDSDFVANIPKSKELYVDDKRQGFAYYYYPDGKLHYKIPYKDNYKHGTAYEYAPNGRIIAIDEYRYNNLVSHMPVNRYDKNGNKTGTWIELYPDGKIKSEITYQQGLPDGVYKEYTPIGTLKKIEVYQKGKLVRKVDRRNLAKSANIQVVEEKYPNGKLKFSKTYKDSIPVGFHKFYDTSGRLVKVLWYDDNGFLKGEGLLDTLGRKTGHWTFFYDTGEKFAEGYYVDGKLDSIWRFYYKNGALMQTGKYIDSLPEGEWKMFYPDGKLLKREYFVNGLRQGKYFELSPEGDTVVKGYYNSGLREGKWYFKIGDEYTYGEYSYGNKTGKWLTYYYPEMILKCEKNYRNGLLNGKIKCYYKNKHLKYVGFYQNGNKEKKWYFYNPDGTLKYTIVYKNDKMVKINDLPIKD